MSLTTPVDRTGQVPAPQWQGLRVYHAQKCPYTLVPCSDAMRTRHPARQESNCPRAKYTTFSRCSWYWGRLASISFMSFKLATPSLHAKGGQPGEENGCLVHTYPLKPAFSLRKSLKSRMSLSMASRICIWRTSVYTVSASDSVTVVSSYAPTAVWNL